MERAVSHLSVSRSKQIKHQIIIIQTLREISIWLYDWNGRGTTNDKLIPNRMRFIWNISAWDFIKMLPHEVKGLVKIKNMTEPFDLMMRIEDCLFNKVVRIEVVLWLYFLVAAYIL